MNSHAVPDHADALPRIPSWVSSGRGETSDEASFFSGAVLAHLHIVLRRDEVPQALLRARLALSAAEVCVILSGRPERAGELRDAVAFLRPGDHPGPAGEIYLNWRRAVERPISPSALHRALPGVDADQIAHWLAAGQGAPVAGAAHVLQTVLADRPRDHVTALLLAEAALAQALGWSHVLPLLGLGLKRTDLRKTGDELAAACHRAVTVAAVEAVRAAGDVTRRAARLKAVAPKLRAKGADAAVGVFLSQDAVPPTALTSLRSSRSARRFCDRLVTLGVVRELTGRDTFRLYGL